MTARLIGGPDLRARLTSLEDVPADFGSTWADRTLKDARAGEPAPERRRGSGNWSTKVGTGPRGDFRAAVYGAFWWVFLDRGTRAHSTMFAPRIRGTKKTRFITKAAQAAFAGNAFSDSVVKLWQRKRLGGPHTRFLP